METRRAAVEGKSRATNIRSGLFASVCLAALGCFGFGAAANAQTGGWIEGYGEYRDDDGRAGVRAFVPFYRDPSNIVFMQASGALSGNDEESANLGFGYRMQAADGLIVGVNGFGDFLDSENGNNFWSLGFGGEVFYGLFEGRANVYLPTDGDAEGFGPKATFNHLLQFDPSGNAFTRNGYQQQAEAALSGFDVEGGLRFDLSDSLGNVDLGIFGGAFDFSADESFIEDRSGGWVRSELTFGDIAGPGSALSFEGRAQFDDVEDEYAGRVTLRIPIGATADPLASNSFRDPMVNRIERREQVALGTGIKDATEDTPLNLMGTTVASTGDCQPLKDAVGNSGNDIVVVSGTFECDILELGLDDFTLVGGNGSTTIGGKTVTTAGEAGEILDNDTSNDLLVVQDNTTGVTISDLSLGLAAGVSPNNADGIQVGESFDPTNNDVPTNVNDVSISGVTIDGFDTGVRFLGSTGTTENYVLTGSTIRNVDLGVVVTGNSSATIEDTLIENTQEAGIFFTDTQTDTLSVNNVTIRNFALDTSFTRAAIAGATGGQPGTGDVIVTNSTFEDGPIGLAFANEDIQVSGNTFTGVTTVIKFGNTDVVATSAGNTASGFSTQCDGSPNAVGDTNSDAVAPASVAFDGGIGNCDP